MPQSSKPRRTLTSLDDLRELLPGGGSAGGSVGAPPSPGAAGRPRFDGGGATVRLSIERKGRQGKTVTIVSGLRHNPDTIREIARLLKERCGTGGTVKEGVIELQGDKRAQAGAELAAMNFEVRGG